jgi:hypothetical protein
MVALRLDTASRSDISAGDFDRRLQGRGCWRGALGGGSFLMLHRGEGLFKVGDQVLRVFQPDRQANAEPVLRVPAGWRPRCGALRDAAGSNGMTRLSNPPHE